MRVFLRCTENDDHCYMMAEVDPDLSLFSPKVKVPCPVTWCPGYMTRRKRGPKSAVYMKAKELFLLTMGRGALEERECNADVLSKLLVGSVISSVDLVDMGEKNRSIVNSLTLKGGRTVHFATSTQGATIYKVTKE